jgi:hypothetical protein
MKPWLSKSAETLRNQINREFPDRDKRSDGWIGDARHSATKSDHNPDKLSGGVVRAIDVDCNLGGPANNAFYLANQLRTLAKKDKRISYIIFNYKIASRISLWKWRKYRGSNPHTSHVHISFTPLGDNDKRKFKLPILGE